MTKYALITDFDGTITTQDIGNALCIHYGLTSPEKIEKAYNSKADAREWMKNHFGSVKTTKEDFERIILEKALVRPGFRDLCLYAKEHDIPFEIASGGLDIYIKPVLDIFDCNQIKIGSVKGVIKPEGIEVTFPDYNGLRMEEFKESRVRHYQKEDYKVIFFGDGPGDFEAARAADIVFATSRLETLLKKHGIKYVHFEDYTLALDLVRGKDVSLFTA
ncbi:MAG: HAD-IB family phosphatase [Elusimicrobiaceae bacterium]|nr:HAD-IB family phosphatase [Elusimicrobiota bacterium]